MWLWNAEGKKLEVFPTHREKREGKERTEVKSVKDGQIEAKEKEGRDKEAKEDERIERGTIKEGEKENLLKRGLEIERERRIKGVK
jgi:hypothetical protein